jgi:predicted dehydrogenase
MKELCFATFGAGFWARFQLAAWRELPGVRCVAIHDRDHDKARVLAAAASIASVYDRPEDLLREVRPDFVDIIADVSSHGDLVRMATAHRIPVICQKPMAPTLTEAQEMVTACREAGVPFLVHENWRWQTPIRAARRILDQGLIGVPFRARIDMISGFPVFDNQPSLKELDRFILSDMGTHILDVARFLFGETASVYATTRRVNPEIKGDDVATVVMVSGPARTTVLCEMAYAQNPLERECFPQALLFVEGDCGSLELAPDYWVRTTTADGTHARRHPPAQYPWADPSYDVVHSSMVPCLANLLGALRAGEQTTAETHAEDHLKTLRLVFAAYESARDNRVIAIEA